jgi:O-succinylbenzoate synthase
MQFFPYEIPLLPSHLFLAVRRGEIIQTELGFGEVAPLPGTSRDAALHFGLSCARIPFPTAFPRIKLCGLVSTLEEAHQATAKGIQVLKVKVGLLTPSQARIFVTQIQRECGVYLRIDVNRKWDLYEARQFLDGVDLTKIEYIEEPLKDPRDLSSLCPAPLALDESLQNPSLWEHPDVTTFVLKPTMLGEKLIPLLSFKKKLIFSSSFESAIGLLHIAHLQARFAPEHAVGLDTFKYFMGNFLPIQIVQGTLSDHPLPPIDRRWLH